MDTILHPPWDRLTQVLSLKGVALLISNSQNLSLSSGYVTPSFLYSEVTSQDPFPLTAWQVTSVSIGKRLCLSGGVSLIPVMSICKIRYGVV